MPRYLALGVTTLKIQGREYPAPLIAELTRIYRRVMDEAAAGAPDLDAARRALDPVLAAGGSDWDPAPEEARLRRAEART